MTGHTGEWYEWPENERFTDIPEKVLGAWNYQSGKSIYDEYTELHQKRTCDKCGKYKERAV